MENVFLKIIPYKGQPFVIEVFENTEKQVTWENFLTFSDSNNYVFSDISYEFIIESKDISIIKDVCVYINDEYEKSVYKDGKIYFPLRSISDKRIFLDCYGFVEISLKFIFENGDEKFYYSDYIPVLVRKSDINESIKAMINYLYINQEGLLFNSVLKSKKLAGFKKSEYTNFESQILLAEQIAEIYENSYGYFKANSRFRIEKALTIDSLDHLEFMSLDTLKYVVSHPEQLKSVNSTVGIRINNRVYEPKKTLLLQNINSYNIYENRVIISFLRKMVDEVSFLKEKCQNLLEKIPYNEVYSDEYVYSSYFMFIETKRRLERKMIKLTEIYDKFAKLWIMYNNALTVSADKLLVEPRPSAIFMTEPHYNRIFLQIYKWFNFGIYDFAKEKFMLSFIKISALYESYLLAKLIKYFGDKGYVLYKKEKCIYPVSKKQKYKNTNFTNTFFFSNSQRTITLYYQPVIFDTDQTSINGIGLYRNNSISIYSDDDVQASGHYYVPDYLIKIEENNKIKYFIIDAKFSDITQVRKHYIKDLAFKYLFSISTIDNNDIIKGMSIIYGKCSEDDKLMSVYDNKIGENEIIPIVETLPLIESVSSENQYSKLDNLFMKILE